ncbi:MAG TPA: hypothetical protein VL025_02705, partial [Thermoanaerobaculia bacterium]|nr:hypothetical protein [Thermoanaerobaculia bacterium]
MRKMVKSAVQATAVVLALGLAATASAGENAAPKKVVKKTQVEVAKPGGAGFVAGVDPVTGKPRQPLPADFKALSEAMTQMFAAAPTSVTVTEYADGSISADLGETFMNMTLIRINPDGTSSEACVESLDQALEFFAQTPA